MRLLLIPLIFCLPCCDKKPTEQTKTNQDEEELHAYYATHEVEIELPIAEYDRTLHPHRDGDFVVEIKFRHDGYQVEDSQALQVDDGGLYQELKKHRKSRSENIRPMAMIVAPTDTSYSRISQVIIEIAKAGYSNVCFAVKRYPNDYNLVFRYLHIDFPLANGNTPSPDTKIFLLRLDQDGGLRIYENSAETKIGNIRNDSHSAKLKAIAAVAEAEGNKTLCQLSIPLKSTHQELVKLLSLLRSEQIDLVFLTHLVGDN